MVEVSLDQPIQTLKGETISVVTVNAPTSKHLKDAFKASASAYINDSDYGRALQNEVYQQSLVASVTGINLTDIEKTITSDFAKIWTAIESFFTQKPPANPTS